MTKILEEIPFVEKYNDVEDKNLGIVVDVETTDSKRDSEIFELSILPFYFDDDLNLGTVKSNIVLYSEPSHPISDFVKKLTGIDESKYVGKRFDLPKIQKIFSKAEIVLAHNATFDRYFCEKDLRIEDTVWACSMNDYDWKNEKLWSSRSLDYLLFKYGFYFEHHKSENDTRAALHLVSQEDIFKSIMTKVYSGNVNLSIFDTVFEEKEKIKELGFYWRGVDKSWVKDNITQEECDDITEKLDSSLTKFNKRVTQVDPNKRFKGALFS